MTTVSWLRNAVRDSPATIGLAVLLLAIFAYEWSTPSPGYDYVSGNGRLPSVIIRYGVISSLSRSGEWWRLVTAGFLHASVLHIALNMWGLVYAGPFVERWFGSRRMLTIFLAAVVVGDIAALMTTDARTVTIGASGGIVGLFAAIITVGQRFWSQRDEMVRGVIPLVATLFNGFTHPSISNAAHIGGAVGGFAMAWVIGVSGAMRDSTQERQERELEASASFGRHLRQPTAEEISDPRNVVTLRLSRKRQAAYIASAVGVFALGLFLVWDGLRGANLIESAGGVIAMPLAVLWANGTRRMRLVLTPEGFTNHAMVTRSVRWRDIVPSFAAGSISGQPMVFFRLRPEIEAARSGASLLNAGTQNVPAIYGLSATDQARLMAETYKRWVVAETSEGEGLD